MLLMPFVLFIASKTVSCPKKIIQYVASGPITKIFVIQTLYMKTQAYTANKHEDCSNCNRVLCLNKGLIAGCSLSVNIP